MKLTTVFLDAGGIILDETAMDAAYMQLLAELVAGYVPGYSLADANADFTEAVARFSPSVYRYVLWKHCTSVSQYDTLLAQFLELRRQRYREDRLMPGIQDQIRLIANRFRIGIAGQYGRELLDVLAAGRVIQYFTYQFTQDDFQITKPDPRYFEQILCRCNLRPQECILVGDRIDNDVIPARQVGMKTVRVRQGLYASQSPRMPSEVPDREIDAIDQLAEALFSLQP